ncbi:DEKNAAC102388 [Brettanomyces naardenensis]|uniref:DEKNAAC102388 n=1 Tax=Brettanomyces naardenensis TaxID=13370 RepID=A0A448YKD1_BRENA|nr:DEKNAAC102388 [Brettanomyces naardenensis]
MDAEYDEFGNIIGESGGESDLSSLELVGSEKEGEQREEELEREEEVPIPNRRTDIILPEDKAYYPSVSEVFDGDVQTIIATSDAKDISQPIVEPPNEEIFKVEERELPPTVYSKEYMWSLLKVPSKIRNVAICGNLHSGKTSFVDMLVQETHQLKQDTDSKNYKPLRYTDNQTLEIDRGVSIRASTITLLLPNLGGSSLVCNIVDSPGHTNFVDEVVAAVRLADVVVLVVDVVEGVTKATEIAIELALNTNTSMCLMLSKIDRLILELRLPPLDAYYKIRRTIDQVNEVISDQKSTFSPILGNVCFESSAFNICFTLKSFAKLYIERRHLEVAEELLAKELWGNVYFLKGKFTSKPDNVIASAPARTFVKFILDPLYKIVTQTLTMNPKDLETFVRNQLGVLSIRHPEFKLDPQHLLKRVLSAFVGPATSAFADMLQYKAPSPDTNGPNKVGKLYLGPTTDSNIMKCIADCDACGPLVAYVSRLVNSSDGSRFYAEVRVLSGTLKESSSVKLLGESYSQEFSEDMKIQDIRRTFLECGRYRIRVGGLPAGSVGIISGHGIDSFITKTATIYDAKIPDEEMYIFKPLESILQPVFKVAVQPLNPSDLTKFIEGLKNCNKSYVGCEIKVEEGGEHAIIGYGELYMDCLLGDLRKLYTKIDIRVSDPLTRFAETCIDMSAVQLNSESNNKKNSITIIAEPLDPEISVDLEKGTISSQLPARQLSKFFRQKYGWDALAARSIWAFGPVESHSTCILCDDTLAGDVDKDSIVAVKEAIVQGFKWAAREGPLCNEPIRDIRFRIIDADISSSNIEANSAQIIQMVRNACHSAIMTATPRLLEPVYEIEIFCPRIVVNKLTTFLDKRRGSIISKAPLEGTQLYRVIGTVPVIDSVGLETDVRLLTQGKAMCQLIFNRWQVVPGDPMNGSCYIPLLKPAPLNSLARDFTMKTRKRKGLDNGPSIQKYVTEETWTKLKSAGLFD